MTTQQSFSHERLYQLLQRCGALSGVKAEVFRNHDDNQWWPLAVSDWRLRLVIAGWSTRVSYHMISTYRGVVEKANNLGYDQLCTLPDDEIEQVVASIGLARTRCTYFRSVQSFLQQSELTLEALHASKNDVLIEQFAANVTGAGYKVAQCAILYAKGYHCGIFPVDSGMKDMLGPCLGLSLPRTPIAHEIMRQHLEGLLQTHASSYLQLARELEYGTLALPHDSAPVWWAHLVLIYFKRQFCNVHHPHLCPLRLDQEIGSSIGTMCDRSHPQPGDPKHAQSASQLTATPEESPFGGAR
jgi:endonuclease III-like uncharacterized protein